MVKMNILRRYTVVASLFCVMFFGAFAQLSPSSRVSVLTCGAGNDYYLAFGHSSIRVCDTALGIDKVYNYGTFDFDTPNLYLKFALGNLDYMLGVESFDYFLRVYRYEGRWVEEQLLDLTLEERNRVFNTLEENAKGDNKYYRYDFFRDNCATRIYDIISQSADSTIFSLSVCTPQSSTLREMIYPYTESKLAWWQFGVDVLLGRRCDMPMPTEAYNFLPFYLNNELAASSYCVSTERLLSETKEDVAPTAVTPMLVFFALVILQIILLVFKQRKMFKCLSSALFFLVGLIGLVVALMWAFSSHWCVKENLNIFWVNPLYLILLFCPKKFSKYLVYLLLASLALSVLVFVAGWQQYNVAVIPVVISLAMSLIYKIYDDKRNSRTA